MKRDLRKPVTLDEIEATLSPARRARIRALAATMAAEERALARLRKAPVKKARTPKVEKLP